MDKDTELAEKAFHGDFYELPISSPPKARTISKKPAESSKINKKPRSKIYFKVTTSDYLLMNSFSFSNTIYRITKNHITIKESTNSFSNSILDLNKINISTTLENNKEAFIHRDIPIKNL